MYHTHREMGKSHWLKMITMAEEKKQKVLHYREW
jgi:hypothetical protein